MPRINPLNRRPSPKSHRLVVAVRGAAGTGKTHFAASLADAGQGRLCFFDTERKARLVKGADGSRFDALEIQHPDELPEFIDWALEGEGREQGYGCYVLDSWTMYFSRKHRETLQAVRARTGDPLAQPNAEELQADQVLFQEVLRRLCIDSGACVVVTDQIGARGKEEREENELGQVLPMTASGLEYFVDVLLEFSVRLDGFDVMRVARVVKSNSSAFPLGSEFINPTFADLLARLNTASVGLHQLANHHDQHSDELGVFGLSNGVDGAEVVDLPDLPDLSDSQEADTSNTLPTLQELLDTAAQYGVSREGVVMAARLYCQVAVLERLTGQQIADLYTRLQARYASITPEEAAVEPTADARVDTGPDPSQNSRLLAPEVLTRQSVPQTKRQRRSAEDN